MLSAFLATLSNHSRLPRVLFLSSSSPTIFHTETDYEQPKKGKRLNENIANSDHLISALGEKKHWKKRMGQDPTLLQAMYPTSGQAPQSFLWWVTYMDTHHVKIMTQTSVAPKLFFRLIRKEKGSGKKLTTWGKKRNQLVIRSEPNGHTPLWTLTSTPMAKAGDKRRKIFQMTL